MIHGYIVKNLDGELMCTGKQFVPTVYESIGHARRSITGVNALRKRYRGTPETYKIYKITSIEEVV